MFHVGQHVVCVRKGPWRGAHPIGVVGFGPARNEVCFVTGVHQDNDGITLELREWDVDPEGVWWSFSAKEFRPLQDSRLDIFRQLLVNPPKQGVDA